MSITFHTMDAARRRRDLALAPAERLKAGFALSKKAFEMLGPAGQASFIAKQRASRIVKSEKSAER